MTNEEIKNAIAEVVSDMQGCKPVELAAKVATRLLDIGDVSQRIPDLVDECVAEGRIIEIEYTLPNMPDRVKSFYLPKGTGIVNIIDNTEHRRPRVARGAIYTK